MTSQIEDIRKHDFVKDEKLFIDTNICIYVYYGMYPFDNKYFRKFYTNAFEKMRASGSKIFLDAFILSEFINVFGHLEYERNVPPIKREKNKNNYKIFRESSKGRDTAREIVINVNKILSDAKFCDLNYNFLNLPNQLIEYKETNSDFNDITYAKLCEKHGFMLVTHDGDFKDCGIRVLTANNKLLGI